MIDSFIKMLDLNYDFTVIHVLNCLLKLQSMAVMYPAANINKRRRITISERVYLSPPDNWDDLIHEPFIDIECIFDASVNNNGESVYSFSFSLDIAFCDLKGVIMPQTCFIELRAFHDGEDSICNFSTIPLYNKPELRQALESHFLRFYARIFDKCLKHLH